MLMEIGKFIDRSEYEHADETADQQREYEIDQPP
jgi:hypothetical protein